MTTAFLEWLGQTYGIWIHDYWIFYIAIAIGGCLIVDIWRRLRKWDTT